MPMGHGDWLKSIADLLYCKRTSVATNPLFPIDHIAFLRLWYTVFALILLPYLKTEHKQYRMGFDIELEHEKVDQHTNVTNYDTIVAER